MMNQRWLLKTNMVAWSSDQGSSSCCSLTTLCDNKEKCEGHPLLYPGLGLALFK